MHFASAFSAQTTLLPGGQESNSGAHIRFLHCSKVSVANGLPMLSVYFADQCEIPTHAVTMVPRDALGQAALCKCRSLLWSYII